MAKGLFVRVKGCVGVWFVAKVWPEAKVLNVVQEGASLLVRAEEVRRVA